VICPKCRSEYVAGVTVCYDCGVDLVESLAQAGHDARPDDERRGDEARPSSSDASAPVVVFVTSDPGLMAIAQTMLESARIPLLVEGGAQHGFFGAGSLAGFHPIGPMFLRVAPRDVEDARAALADLLADSEGPGATER
jgi:hypothetical protein